MNLGMAEPAKRLIFRPAMRYARYGGALAICIAVVLIWAVFAVLAYKERLYILQQGYISASNTGRVLALDLGRNLDVLALSLHGLEGGLAFPQLASLPLAARNQVLYDRAASADFFANLFVVNDRGDLTIDPVGITPRPLNYADRDYFSFLRDHQSDETYVSRPLFSKVGDGWTMPVARRLNRADGSFAGAVVGGLRLAYINRLLQQFDVGRHDTIGLIRTDGTIIARWPGNAELVGTTIEDPFCLTAGSQSGLAGHDDADGVNRLWFSKQVGSYPLTVIVGISTSNLLANWYWRLSTTALILVTLSAFIATLTLWLTGELSRRTRSEASLARQHSESESRREQFDAALENMSQGLTFSDCDRRLIVCNKRYGEIYGLSPEQTRAGTSLSDVFHDRFLAGTFPDVTPSEYLARFDAGSNRAYDFLDTLRDGRIVASHYRPLPNGEWVTTHEDVTERCRAEEHITYMARHDSLTCLPNRVVFQERLEQAIETAGRGYGCAVLCVDLDRFKAINDSLGHSVGDGLLRAVAERMLSYVRARDTVARLGGDEFAIIQHAVERPEDVEALANRLIAAFQKSFEVDGHRIVIGISIGVALIGARGITSTNLLKNADLALYLSKEAGGSVVRFFEPEMEALMQLRRDTERDLREAISRGDFELYYQPLINLVSGKVTGFEALLRWRHPVRGLVLPAEFISILEETGLIVTVGEWVLRTACLEAEKWSADITVAVNLSPIQFRKGNLAEVVRSALEESGLRPDRLELEITESVLLLDTDDNVSALRQLRALGITVALDDFGTGYSSLSYLRRFPFDKIKIDKSFVRDLVKNKESALIIRAVTGLGQSLGIRTLAEGVETLEQLNLLRNEGCSEAQGYLFGAPSPANDLELLIASIEKRTMKPNIALVRNN